MKAMPQLMVFTRAGPWLRPEGAVVDLEEHHEATCHVLLVSWCKLVFTTRHYSKLPLIPDRQYQCCVVPDHQTTTDAKPH